MNRLHIINELISIKLMDCGPANVYVPSESNMATDLNLLFGLLALQNRVINQAQLEFGFQAWTLDMTSGCADHLKASGDLSAPGRGACEGLVEVYLVAQRGLVERSWAAVSAGRSTPESLADLATNWAGVVATPIWADWAHAGTVLFTRLWELSEPLAQSGPVA
jgi:hypothetical protein